uniref:Uncharacterized protein n=1 Tax=Podoviridae sp. ct7K12 TaxID=2826540 RepID=A0A8S5N7X8_9CAUD|nr:MAG TPA: hypothetical protein [Podoviridae sp. ct7K12]
MSKLRVLSLLVLPLRRGGDKLLFLFSNCNC